MSDDAPVRQQRVSIPIRTGGVAPNRRLRWGSTLIALAGLFTVAHGLLFLYRTYATPGFEAGVSTLDGLTHAELAAVRPEVASYVTHVHVTLAGLFVAIGIAVVALAWFGVRRGRRWALTTALVVPLVFLVPSLGVHRTVAFSYHTLVHLGPAAVGGPLLFAGVVLSSLGLHAENASGDET